MLTQKSREKLGFRYKCILLLWELKWWAMWKGSFANKDGLDDIMAVAMQKANISARNKQSFSSKEDADSCLKSIDSKESWIQPFCDPKQITV